MLTMDGCRRRQQRLLTVMEENRWDLFLTGNFRTIYYLTGALRSADEPVVLLLRADGSSVLASAHQADAAVTERIGVETYSIARTITQPFQDAAALVKDALSKRPAARSAAVERAGTIGLFESLAPTPADASAVILRLRKRKEEDEIDEIRGSLECCAVAYRAAKAAIAPGLTEVDVYNAMDAAIARHAGTSVVFLGDFACGERGIRGGGPPTMRKILPGDLYILDIFPAPALYAGDTCRTFAVGAPTDLQHKAWEAVCEVILMAEAAIQPGTKARDAYRLAKEFLDSHSWSEKSFWHHLGHGIGHHGHEAPRIIPGTDDVFEVGDVITLEPGVYAQALQGGIRLEDNYVVRENGLENLFTFPRDL